MFDFFKRKQKTHAQPPYVAFQTPEGAVVKIETKHIRSIYRHGAPDSGCAVVHQTIEPNYLVVKGQPSDLAILSWGA